MATEKIDIDQFMDLSKCHPVLDVRSPDEYRHAHMPRAINLPLFTDEQRKVIGTMYKLQGREQAILEGLGFFGASMQNLVKETLSLIPDKHHLLIHCWRGGMRSQGMAWLLDLCGYRVFILKGGYKAYRNWVLNRFARTYDLRVLGGYTGSGKTALLENWGREGGNMINLEELACHRGSAFGAMENKPQPSQEMFENLLAEALWLAIDSGAVWLEDESQAIGHVVIPPLFWQQMRQARVLFLEIPFEARLDRLIREYGNLDKQLLMQSIGKVGKRLGGLTAREALQWLETGNTRECFRILLTYYDKYYGKSIQGRKSAGSMVETAAFERPGATSAASVLGNMASGA